MLNQKDILATQDMIDKRHLDIRTITMGISLMDCCDPDLKTCCDKIYQKITTKGTNRFPLKKDSASGSLRKL